MRSGLAGGDHVDAGGAALVAKITGITDGALVEQMLRRANGVPKEALREWRQAGQRDTPT